MKKKPKEKQTMIFKDFIVTFPILTDKAPQPSHPPIHPREGKWFEDLQAPRQPNFQTVVAIVRYQSWHGLRIYLVNSAYIYIYMYKMATTTRGEEGWGAGGIWERGKRKRT